MEELTFEQNLTVGQTVEARWTWNHQLHKAKAEVVKINKSSVRVKLLEDISMIGWVLNPDTGKHVLGNTPYQIAGREIVVPLFRSILTQGNSKWSHNNGVFPVGA